MRTYILLILTLLSIRSFAQDKRTNDSLLKILSVAKEDTNKANILIQLCRNNLDIDNKAVAKYTRELFSLSTKLNFGRGLADSYNFLGIIEDDKTNYGKALDLYKIAMRIAIKHGLDKKKASIENNIGLIYWKIGAQQKALGYYYDALKIFEKLDDKKLQANVLSNIGLIQSSLQDDKKSLEFYRKALAIRLEINDEYGLASVYNNMSKTFTHMQKEDSAKHYAWKAITLQEKIGDNYGLGIGYGNIGLSYSYDKQFDSAQYYLIKSVRYRQMEDDKLGLIFSYHAMAENYNGWGKYDLATQYGEKALALAKEIKSKEREATVLHSLADIYSNKREFKKAYDAMIIFTKYRSDIFDTLKNKQAEELAIKYEVDKKDILIEKDRVEIANKTLALKQRNTQLTLLGILLLATGLVSYLIYYRYRARQNERLQKEIIKQQDIAARAIIEAEEAERKRIASDLHDGVGQLCSAIKMNLSGLSSQINFTTKETALTFEKTLAITDEACREVRSISHQMMPNILLKSGLANAVRNFLDKIDSPRLQVRLDIFGMNDRLDSKIETVLYRVIQEAVNNVIKHAKANELYITLDRDTEGISATIEDNGTGFDVNDREKFNGIGLKNISSRVAFLNGKVEFDSAPGRGTVVNVWIPS